MDDNLKGFLKELAELTNKYRIEIAGCGCCSSPYLLNTRKKFKVISKDLKFNRKSKEYSVEEPGQDLYQYKGQMYNQDGIKDSELGEFWPYKDLQDFRNAMGLEEDE